ncbi:bifunctional riboflavin kinase/FAD synthetase [Candidatus Pseudomonas adelgestsugas]
MQLVRGLHNLRPEHRGCVATIGNFDGVHRGHQALLGRLRKRAVELGVPSCVVIFEPQPQEFFIPSMAPARLACLRDKQQLLTEEGVSHVLCLAFNQLLQSFSAVEFIDRILVHGLGVKHLEVGDDFRFGYDRDGDFNFLQNAGMSQGFTVEAAQTVKLDGVRISSTQVRNALGAADFAMAKRLLGRQFSIAGRVLRGQKLARQLGAPTANVQLKRRRVPLAGVYLVSVDIDGQSWPGVANIGVRPTVISDGAAHLEVHLLDFVGDLYDRHLTVVFHHKLREEQCFASLEALKIMINADVATARILSCI